MVVTIPSLPDPVLVELDGATIATYRLGDGPVSDTVVFCHGTPWSARVWAEAAIDIARHRPVLLWDMPGYGRSTKDPSVPLGLGAQGARLAALLDRFGLERPHVVAHDVGGAVALGAHLRQGRDYASLALWDAVTLDPWGSPFFRLVAEHADVFAALPPRLHAALVTEYIAGAGNGTLPAAALAVLREPWTDAEGQSGFYRQIAALRPADTRPLVERLADIRCPVTIGWGGEDPWIPVEQAHRLRAAIPGASEPLILDGVGHLAPVEAADRVADAIRDGLAVTG